MGSNLSLFSRIRNRASREVFGRLAKRKVNNYLVANQLDLLASRAMEALGSTGADPSDYALLHSYIRCNRPKYVLECGTGVTTWVMADALRKNWEESGKRDEKPMLVSMEDQLTWFEKAEAALPDQFRSFVSLTKAERVYDHYCYAFGVRYDTVPEYPYELMWVDGPTARYMDKPFDWQEKDFEHVCLMDLVRIVQRQTQPMTVMIDNLKRSQIIYASLFGPEKIKCYPHYANIGVMRQVTSEDLIANELSYQKIWRSIVPAVHGPRGPW